MKKIIIKNQQELDQIRRVEKDEEIVFESNNIEIKFSIEVFGILRLKGVIKSEWGKHIVTRETGCLHSESRGSSQVHSESRESSQVHSVSRGSSQVHSVSRESSQEIGRAHV